jgi:6-phosphofructokinase 1
MDITILGEPRYTSPVKRTVSDKIRIPEIIKIDPDKPATSSLVFEMAGPRARLYFDPECTRAGIVTCGGLCPGLNNVIRLHRTGPCKGQASDPSYSRNCG